MNKTKNPHALAIYTYDSSGERTIKDDITQKYVLINGVNVVSSEVDKFTLYPSGMLVVNPEYNLTTKTWALKYTKHYYAGSQRIVSKIGSSTADLGKFLNPWMYQTQLGGEIPINNIKEAERLYKAAYDNKINVYNNWNLPKPTAGYSDYGTEYTNSIATGIEEKPNRYFYHPDHLGSTSYITDNNGEVSQHIEYIPFGETFVSEYKNAGYNSPYRFNAKEFDSNTGLYYFGARYMNPKYALWLNPDPLGDFNPFMNSEHYIDGEHNDGVFNNRNLNAYIYCYQSPIVYYDPNGKQSISGYIQSGTSNTFSLKHTTFLNAKIRTGIFAAQNPIYATLIGESIRGSNNISTIATRFGTTGDILSSTLHKTRGKIDECSEIGAFRHTLWQAIITNNFGSDIAKGAGNAHEDNPNVDLSIRIYNNESDADQSVDLLNNVIGRKIGNKANIASNIDLANDVLEEFKTNGLYQSKQNKDDKWEIYKQKLSQEKYQEYHERLKTMNSLGRTPEEQQKVDNK